MPSPTPRPQAGFPDFRRDASGSIRPLDGFGGSTRLLAQLVATGLDPDALAVAAALVTRLDDDARVLAEERRERARLGGLARQAARRAA